jgi:hypothetical protein
MAESFDRQRRNPRYAAHIEIHVAVAGRNLVTLTREISRAGLFFFVEPAPPVGERVRCTLYPDAHEPFSFNAIVRYTLPGVGVGIEISDELPNESARFRAFVEEQATSARAWRAIGGFVREEGQNEEEEEDPGINVDFEQKEMIDVGESGEAFRVFFERYPPIAPEHSSLKDQPDALTQAKLLLSGVSSEPVHIKLHARDRLRTAHLGVLAKTTGYVAIVPPATASEKFAFYSLSGREQLMTKEGDRAVFPFFTTNDLARIRRDCVSAVDSGRRKAISALDSEGSISMRYVRAKKDNARSEGHALRTDDLMPVTLSQWTRFSDETERLIIDLFDVLQAETRVYVVGGIERPVRLLRNLTVMVRGPRADAQDQGTLLHDGRRVCVLTGLKTREQMRIRPLSRDDEIRLPAW